MESGIIIALIASFTALFASIMTFIGILYNFSKPKKHSVLEMQLTLVFSPIHNILSIHEELSDEQRYEIIDKVIKDNYVLVHPNIYKLFYKKNNKAFYEQIDKCYSYARSKLGYDQIKGTRYDTQTKNLVATNSAKTQIFVAIITGIFTILACLITVFTSNQSNFNREYLSGRYDILATTNDNLAANYDYLGSVYWKLGEYIKALEFYDKALLIKEQVLGSEHPDIADTYCNMGSVYEDLGAYEQAIQCFQKGLDIYCTTLGKEHPKTVVLEIKLQNLISKENE